MKKLGKKSIITEIINKSGSDHWVARKTTDIDSSTGGEFCLASWEHFV